MNIPFYNRLSVRLTLLILVVVAVLRGVMAAVHHVASCFESVRARG